MAPRGDSPFAEVHETHTGVVFLVGDRAYKLKKPVSFGFVDFTGREARRRACQREVELNRRLAPDVYLGVADVAGPGGEPCEHLVVMRRLPAARRLRTLAEGDTDLGPRMRELGRLLASFHSRAERSAEADEAGGPDALMSRWEANDRRIRDLAAGVVDPAAAEVVLGRAARYLAGRRSLLEARVSAGRCCDGHGDLLADDIFCLDDGPRVLDCLEFNDSLRLGDGLADVAFLAMDLQSLGRADLGAGFLSAYREFSGDGWPASLAHHHIAYRAQVRALVTGIRAAQGDTGAGTAARALLGLAGRHLDEGRVRLVVVGGLPATGKSTVAGWAAEGLGAVLLSSDEVRKQAAGLDVTTPAPAGFGEGLYRPEVTAATYATLIERARLCLAGGESVVIDATFSDPAWREAARGLAADTHSDLDEVLCAAPAEVTEARLARRGAAPGRVSDATTAVARRMAAGTPPWPSALRLTTTAAPDTLRREVLARLGIGAGPHPAPVTFDPVDPEGPPTA